MTLPIGATLYTLPDGRDEVLAEETPVALVFDGVTQAVMMATPADLEDFLVGFALTEGLIQTAAELSDIEAVEHPKGIEVRGWLAQGAGVSFRERRRAMAGPVGCGLCGIDSLEQALRPLPDREVVLSPLARAPGGAGGGSGLTPATAARALDALRPVQTLKDVTHATHAAGFWDMAEDRIVTIREDVGRHNALDKLVGAIARAGGDMASGAVAMTSRLSVDLVQKAVVAGAGAIIAPSSPTALAVREAEAARLTVFARATGGMTQYTNG